MSPFSGISLLSRFEVLAITDALSLALAEGLNSDDLNTLGNVLATVGSVLMTFDALAQENNDQKNQEQ